VQEVSRSYGRGSSDAYPFEHNPFLLSLRKRRYEATTALMVAAHAASFSDPMVSTKFVRKFLFEDIKTTIDVVCPGFTSCGEDIPETTISMLTAQYHNSRIWFELGPKNFDYIRRGVRHTMFDVPARKREDKHSAPEFVGCPQARLRDDRCGVYCRWRNGDGKWSMKTVSVTWSDDHAMFTERQMTAAMAAQSHFDTHRVPAVRKKSRVKKSRGDDGDEEVEVVAEDASDGDEEVSVEAEEDNEAVTVENAEDLPNEEASASGVNRGAA